MLPILRDFLERSSSIIEELYVFYPEPQEILVLSFCVRSCTDTNSTQRSAERC